MGEWGEVGVAAEGGVGEVGAGVGTAGFSQNSPLRHSSRLSPRKEQPVDDQ